MGDHTTGTLDTIIVNNAPYWVGEYAVAYEYFTARKRTQASDVQWLELQMFKEWTGSGVYGDRTVTVTGVIKSALDQLYSIESGGKVDSLEAISNLLRFGLDEFNHFTILYEIYRRLVDGNTIPILEMGHLREAKNIVEVRQQYRESHPDGNLIVDLTEGGGLGMYFGISDAFAKTGIQCETDELIREFARMTIRDETEHMSHRFSKAAALGLSSKQWREVDENLQKLFAAKLRERNEQFGYVFPPEKLEAFAAGIEAGQEYVRRNLPFLGSYLKQAA